MVQIIKVVFSKAQVNTTKHRANVVCVWMQVLKKTKYFFYKWQLQSCS